MTAILRIAAAFAIGLGAARGVFASPTPVNALEAYRASEPYADYYASASSSAVEESTLVAAAADEVAIDEMSPDTAAACDELMCGVCCPATWYVSAGAIVLHRSRPDPGTTFAANPAGTRFLSASDFNFGWNWGPDITVGRRMASGNVWEMRFFSNQSSASQTFITPGGFTGGGFTGPGGTRVDGDYFTKLYSTELNWRSQVSNPLQFIAGFRWIELRDQLTYVLNSGVATGRYNFNNHLYGGQMGVNWVLTNPARPLQINMWGKAGLYGNLADGGIKEFSGPNFIGSFAGSRSGAAFVGDLGFSASYFITNNVAIRGGYQLLWLSELALAGDAASRSLWNPSLLRNVDNGGNLFYNGAMIGVDVRW